MDGKRFSGLAYAVANVVLPHGIVERDVLLGGGDVGMAQLYQIGKGKYGTNPTQTLRADCIFPHNIDHRSNQLFKQLGSYPDVVAFVQSEISCIKPGQQMDGSASNHFAITTLGSPLTSASVNTLDLSVPLDFGATHFTDALGGYDI